MQNYITTNIQMPREIWKAVKIRAAEEGCSMKDIILRAIGMVLGGKTAKPTRRRSVAATLLEFAGSWKNARLPADLSENHDDYIYGKVRNK